MTVTSYTDYVNRFGETEVIPNSGSYSYFTSIAAYNYFQNGGQTLLVTRVVSGTYSPASSSITNIATNPAFSLVTISEGAMQNSFSTPTSTGALPSGSANNIRWEIVSSKTSSGTFNLYIRRGDDDNKNKAILETYTGLSMDPLDDNYVARRIGDYQFTQENIDGEDTLQITGTYPNKSRYVRIGQVFTPTPQYFLGGVPNPSYINLIPANGSGSFNGGTGASSTTAKFYDQIESTNIQGLQAANYTSSINLLKSANDFQFNTLIIPGLNYADHDTELDTIITNTQERGDNILVIDLGNYSSSASEVINTAASIDSSYVAAYYPWVQTLDPATNQYVFVPASTMIPGVYAFNDRVADPWFAPTGQRRTLALEYLRRLGPQKLGKPSRCRPTSWGGCFLTAKSLTTCQTSNGQRRCCPRWLRLGASQSTRRCRASSPQCASAGVLPRDPSRIGATWLHQRQTGGRRASRPSCAPPSLCPWPLRRFQ